MNEVDFFWACYPEVQAFTKQQIEEFFDVYKDRIVKVYDGEQIKGIAFYFKLSDETLSKIQEKELDLTDFNIVNQFFKENGDNIHFFAVVADGYKTIMDGIRKIKNYKSISWFSPDMEDFFIRRLQCHH